MWAWEDTFSQGQSKSWPQVYSWYELIAGVSFQERLYTGESVPVALTWGEDIIVKIFYWMDHQNFKFKHYSSTVFLLFTFSNWCIYGFERNILSSWVNFQVKANGLILCVRAEKMLKIKICVQFWYFNCVQFDTGIILDIILGYFLSFLVLFTENMAFNILFLFFICVCESRGGRDSPRTRITGNYEPACGCWDWTQALCKSSTWS